MLHVIDEAWKENLRELDELKHSVQNASYEQKDPLLIFKLESVQLFDKMVNKINNQTISILMRGQVPEQQVEAPDDAAQRRAEYEAQRRARAAAAQRAQYTAGRGTTAAPRYERPDYAGGTPADLNDPAQQAAAAQDTREQQPRTPFTAEKVPGRNDPCPCGSGKKFKNCHGRNL
jgi:preprotein translocase subunit SecA